MSLYTRFTVHTKCHCLHQTSPYAHDSPRHTVATHWRHVLPSLHAHIRRPLGLPHTSSSSSWSTHVITTRLVLTTVLSSSSLISTPRSPHDYSLVFTGPSPAHVVTFTAPSTQLITCNTSHSGHQHFRPHRTCVHVPHLSWPSSLPALTDPLFRHTRGPLLTGPLSCRTSESSLVPRLPRVFTRAVYSHTQVPPGSTVSLLHVETCTQLIRGHSSPPSHLTR